MRRLAAFLIVLLGCATLAIRAHATTSLGLSLHVTDSADSIFVRLTWSPVRDARGDTVAEYVAAIRDGEVLLGSTRTRDTTYVVAVENGARGPEIILSRSHPNFVRRLFESEVSEIADRTVEIRSLAREAGSTPLLIGMMMPPMTIQRRPTPSSAARSSPSA